MKSKPEMVAHNGVWYCSSERAAGELLRTLPGTAARIVKYTRGYAVQNGPSGEYLGPNCLNPKQWACG